MPFRPVPVTAEGTPHYLGAETTLLADGNVVLEHGGFKDTGKVYLTTHRLLWVSATRAGAALALALRHVKEVNKANKGTFKKHYFLVVTAHCAAAAAGADAASSDGGGGSGEVEQAVLSLPSSSVRDKWLTKTQLAVVRAVRAFQESASSAAAAGPAGGGGGGSSPGQQQQASSAASRVAANLVGVAGRRNARWSTMQEQSEVTASAFESIQSLKLRAKEVVSMIEEFARNPSNKAVAGGGMLESAGATAGGGVGGTVAGDEAETKEQFQSLLQTVNISNPVLRGAYAGKGAKALRAFEQEVSLELARFIREPLQAAGGILLLTDVYCLYNRARGSSVISPEELVEACDNWAKLPTVRDTLVLHAFPSGVKVIREAAHTDAMVFKRLEELLAPDASGGGSGGSGAWRALSAMEVSVHMRVGLLIAEEYLLAAEANRLLARDDTVEGLYFYRNEFATA